MDNSNNSGQKCVCVDCLAKSISEYIEYSYLDSPDNYADDFLALIQYLSAAATNLTALLTSDTNDLPAIRSADASKVAANNLMQAYAETQKLLVIADEHYQKNCDYGEEVQE